MILRNTLQALRSKQLQPRTQRSELRTAESDWRNNPFPTKRALSDAEWQRVQQELEDAEHRAQLIRY